MAGTLKLEEKKTQKAPAPGISLARIMVATDFSTYADRALDYAVSLARRFGSRVYLTHVIAFAGHDVMEPDLGAPSGETLRKQAERNAKAIEDSGRLFGVPYEVVIEEGTLWPALGMLLEKHKIDLLVLGTHGLSGPLKAVFGSNAEQVMRNAAVPVLTVGPAVTEEAPFEEEFRTIVFATDFRPGAEREAALAYAIAQEHRSHLLMMHVTPYAPGIPQNESLLDRELITHQMQELVPGGERKCLLEFHIAYGEPASEILRVAEESHADLIVVGATKDGALSGHLPGTIAYGVVRGAKCPVLTVKS
ncbi:MAG TPA: universal stress protein [Patescibacteria group bacterium]|nr:universal stress protein [Patescibacteria group bacterium]